MMIRAVCLGLPCCLLLGACAEGPPAEDRSVPVSSMEWNADSGGIHAVKHVIIVMQENHSFDNYLGALAYAPGSPYHGPKPSGAGPGNEHVGCPPNDHRCVDGLRCVIDAAGGFQCANHNRDDDGSTVFAFHDPRRCVRPDLDHSWGGSHREANFHNPNQTRHHAPMDGFVLVNDETEQPDNGTESATDDQTMGFHTQDEIPFYYELASDFAISDRYFASVLGPTFPNRCYLMAATSFGHVTTNDTIPPPGGYQPITGTIFDLLERNQVSWADYYQDAPQAGSFRQFGTPPLDPHLLPLPVFFAQAAGAPELPAVSFVDPNFGVLGIAAENDENAPTDIQRGQAFVSDVINAVRNGPHWADTVLFVVYDEHGGAYDHVPPPQAAHPDGIDPGQCADLSDPPASLAPGGGAECHANLRGGSSSLQEAIELCPALAADPTGPFPRNCATFDQLGARVPFLAISPFAKPHYVSHEIADHTSLLAFIERAFLPDHQHLTERDAQAYDLRDLFDFTRSPSLLTRVGHAVPPVDDCTFQNLPLRSPGSKAPYSH
jgi:phospholipase C